MTASLLWLLLNFPPPRVCYGACSGHPADKRIMMNSTCTGLLSLALATACFVISPTRAWTSQPQEAPSFFVLLRQQAMLSAGKPYQDPDAKELPEFLRALDYDGYQRIDFRDDQALWHSEPFRFRAQFFHPGFLYQAPVRIHVLDLGQSREIQFSPDLFDYSRRPFSEPVPSDLFFTGLRLHYPLDHPTRTQEVAAFLGTSYFRLLGTGQIFGASARGLAIDIAESSGEEFPQFTEFWLEKPAPLADHIRIFARLESRRAAGAYQFLIRPGESTVAEVQASVFLREEVAKLGLAPLTSMFFFGENRDRYFPDFRPEVHDSDGLQFETDEGWFWRPLDNPRKVHRITEFPNPAGFGLMQRDRNPDHYQDLEARYHVRPSFWITPENWGPGRLELLEIPTPEEGNDNIVAYWVPEQEFHAGQEFHFRYTIQAGWLRFEPPPVALWRVHATRLDPGKDGDSMRFIVDWTGHTMPLLARKSVTARVHAARGKIGVAIAQPNDLTDGWRTFFDLWAEGKQPTELRLWLEHDNQKVSETWIYHFDPGS